MNRLFRSVPSLLLRIDLYGTAVFASDFSLGPFHQKPGCNDHDKHTVRDKLDTTNKHRCCEKNPLKARG